MSSNKLDIKTCFISHSNTNRISNYIFPGINNKNYDKDKLAHEKKSLLNLLDCSLNMASGIMFDVKSIGILFNAYNEVLHETFSTSNAFRNSLKISSQCLNDSMIANTTGNRSYQKLFSAIDSLVTDKADSFVILPMFACYHTFCAVIRRQKDGLKFYKIDKFLCEGKTIMPKKDYCIEYTIKAGREKALLKDILANFFSPDIFLLPKLFKENSEKIHVLKVSSREHSIANCIIKEPEAAIKFAFATRNLSTDQLHEFRTSNKFSESFKIKWGLNKHDTLSIHQKLFNKIKQRFPMQDLSDYATNFDNYARNKFFREYVEEGKSIPFALELAFDPQGHFSHLSQNERTRILLRNINMKTVQQIPSLQSLLLRLEGPGFMLMFTDSRLNAKLPGALKNIVIKTKFENIMQSFDRLKNNFPVFVKQAKEYYSVIHLVASFTFFKDELAKNPNFSAANIKPQKFDAILETVQNALSISPYTYIGHFIDGSVRLSKAIATKNAHPEIAKSELPKALRSLDLALKLNPSCAEANYLKALIHDIQNNKSLSRQEYHAGLNKGVSIGNSQHIFSRKSLLQLLPKELKDGLLSLKKDYKIQINKEQLHICKNTTLGL